MNAIDYAIAMEADGENYYAEQALRNKENRIGVVCTILAKAEHAHGQLLREKSVNLSYELPARASLSEISNVFQNLPDIQSDIRPTPTQLEFYRTALDLEQKSIDLYKRLLSESSSREESELFSYLVEQEALHFKLLDEMVTMLRHAEEWVESAEFGLRNESY